MFEINTLNTYLSSISLGIVIAILTYINRKSNWFYLLLLGFLIAIWAGRVDFGDDYANDFTLGISMGWFLGFFAGMLINHKKTPFKIHDEKNLPLHTAAREGNVRKIRRLIKKGASVNKKNSIGETPLFIAARKGNIDVIQLLIDNGADVSMVNNIGDTLLHYTVLENNLEATRILLENGAPANQQNNYRMTPRNYAFNFGFKKILQLLSEHMEKEQERK